MKIKRILIMVAVLLLIATCFSGCYKEEIVNPETFGIDDFIDGHAKYVLGIIKTDVEFSEYAKGCLSSNFCLPCNLPGTFFYVEGSKEVKWKINSVVTRRGWEKNEDAFLYPMPNGDNYPVFFTYTFDVDGEKTDYIARVTQNPENGNEWEVEFVMIPTPAQLECITQTFENNSWHTVTAE